MKLKSFYRTKPALWLATLILILPSFWFFYYRFAHASALSFICASSAAATSTAACTGEQAGDLLLIMCGETSGGASPTLPSAVTAVSGSNLTNSSGPSSSRTGMNVGWTTASNSTSGSGTCGSGTTDTVMMVYSGQAGSPIGLNIGTESGNNSGTTMIYNSDNLSITDGSSWFAAFGLRSTADTQVGSAPTGMTNRTQVPTTTPAAAGFDINGGTSINWSAQTVSGFSANSKYTSIVIELIAAASTISVGSVGNAVSNMTIPSTSNFTGGAFMFLRDSGSTSVTAIKITNTGTVASANISNLFLYYKQEATCESSFPSSGTTQFNSSAGVFVSGAASTTGSMPVGTSQVCLYAKIDIGSGASIGDTLALEIANPSTDVTATAGVVSPISAVTISGSTTLSTGAPTTDQVLRGGEYFSGGSKQPYYWAN